MPGPAPKHPDDRARRNATVAMTTLPRSGRPGRAPAWPLQADASYEFDIAMLKLQIREMTDELEWLGGARERSAMRRRIDNAKKKMLKVEAMKKASTALERDIWKQLWKTPQATQWEKRGWYREVAMFARHSAKGECGSLDDAKEARQREDRLGLNDTAMLKLRWVITDDAATSSGPAPGPRSKRTSRQYGNLRSVG